MDTDRTALEAGAVAALLAPVVKFTSDPFSLREKSNYTPSQRNVPFDTRIHHFTWAWYLPVMGTGGIAVQLHLLPFRFRGLDTIGVIVFLISVAIYCVATAGLVVRFTMWRHTLYNSIRHPTSVPSACVVKIQLSGVLSLYYSEGLFTATFLLSSATILINTCHYGVDNIGEPSQDNWLSKAVEVLFWVYTFCSIVLAIALSYFIISRESHTPQAATPAWALPCFPAMLVGTVGANVSRILVTTANANHHRVFPILITSILLQGFGILISLMFITIFLKRLMLFRLPSPNLRPGMFMAVGPPGFTSFTIIALGDIGRTQFLPSDFGISDDFAVGNAFYVACLLTGMLFYGLAAWWLLLSTTAVVAGAIQKHALRKKNVDFNFHLSWWAFLFPNTGLVGATLLFGKIFFSPAVQWVGTAMVIIEFAVWLMLVVQTPRAVLRGRLMVPGKDEDADVEGFEKKDEVKRW